MNKYGLMPMLASLVVGLSACSDNSDNSSSTAVTSVTVHSNQADIAYGLIRSQVINESGLPSTDFEQQPIVTAVAANQLGEAQVSIPNDEVHLFQLVSRVADQERDVQATTRTCQWAAGCGDDIAFGSQYAAGELLWRAVAYDLGNNEHIWVSPFTELATTLAGELIYTETFNSSAGDISGFWDVTGFYSPHSVVQSISQMQKLLGIDDVHTCAADLSKLDSVSTSAICILDEAVRHGALLAAWQKLALDYQANNAGQGTLVQQVGRELVANKGQLLQSGSLAGNSISLANLYRMAEQNLAAVAVNRSDVAAAVERVRLALVQAAKTFEASPGVLTDLQPDALEALVGNSVSNDLQLGVERSKKFLESLRNYQTDFFEGGEAFKTRLDTYADQLRAIGEEHQAGFNRVILAFQQTRQLYLECLSGNCTSHDNEAGWEWLESVAFANNVLTINGGEIRVSQAVADINLTDNIRNPASSRAIDLLITGTYEIDGVSFVLKHTYINNDENQGIASPSGLRIFYPAEVSEVQLGAEELAYEVRWLDFNLFANRGDVDEFEVEGAFSQFYHGVKNPDNASDERRYNIESVSLNARISNRIDGEDSDDTETTRVSVTARSNNADEFYPETAFVPFSGFFAQRENPVHPDGETVSDLATYRFGSTVLSGQQVEYFDFVVPLAESYRYRFYPNRVIDDVSDLDLDGNTSDSVLTHDFERCLLDLDVTPNVVSSCEPRQRLLGGRNVQQSLNDLWEIGFLSRIQVPNRGTYFINWPATQDQNQCYKLDSLSGNGTMSGVLYDPAVLGLNTLRFSTEVSMQSDTASDVLPDTLLEVTMSAASRDNLELTAVLSHDYERNANGNLNAGVGSGLDRISVVFNTTNDLVDTATLVVFKDGVSLNVEGDNADPQAGEIATAIQRVNTAAVLPYRFITADDGSFDRCVTGNQAEYPNTTALDDAIIPLNYRGVVYGRIRKENGVWVARFVNGEFQSVL